MSQFETTELVLPRGDLRVEGPLRLDMTQIYEAEARQEQTKVVNEATANELAYEFSRASGTLGKYIGWVRYERDKAEEQLELAKARVTLEVCPVEAAKLVHGLKPNDAWRDALYARDEKVQEWNDNLAKLDAVKALLEAKMKQMDRCYYACDKERDKRRTRPVQNLNGSVGMTFEQAQKNFMGSRAAAEKPEVTVDDDVIRALQRV